MTVVPPANLVRPDGRLIVGCPSPPLNCVYMAKVWDIAAGEWRIVERVDALEMVNLGTASWTEPD